MQYRAGCYLSNNGVGRLAMDLAKTPYMALKPPRQPPHIVAPAGGFSTVSALFPPNRAAGLGALAQALAAERRTTSRCRLGDAVGRLGTASQRQRRRPDRARGPDGPGGDRRERLADG